MSARDDQAEADRALAEAIAARERAEEAAQRFEPVRRSLQQHVDENAITWAFKQTLTPRRAT